MSRWQQKPVIHTSQGDWAVLDLESEHPWVPRVYLPIACRNQSSRRFYMPCFERWTHQDLKGRNHMICFRPAGHTGRHTYSALTPSGRLRVLAVWGNR